MNVRNIAVLLTADVASYKTQMLGASAVTHQFTNDVEAAGATASKWSGIVKSGMVAGATLVTVALLGSIAAMSKFETEMRNVNSLTGLSEDQFRSFEQQVISLSTTVPQTATQLAEGLYQIASSGFKGAEGFKVLEASAIAASAGLSTTMVASKAILAVLNAYGLGAEHAAEVGNVLFQGVNVGIFSFDQLAQHIGDVLPVASLMGIELDQVTGALAGISLSGIDVAEGTTSLTRVIQSFIKPSKEMSAQLKSMGYESGSAALDQNTLYQMMEKLRVSAGGNIETIRAWFPEIRAQRGAMALMTAEGKNYTESIKAMENANKGAGAMFDVFTEQMKAPAAQAKLLWNSITAGAIQVGIALIPAITWIISGIRSFGTMLQSVGDDVAPFFEGIREAAGDAVTIGAGLADMFRPFAVALLMIVGIPIVATLNALGSAISSVTGFLADHVEVVFAVTAAYVGFKAAVLFGAVWPQFISLVRAATMHIQYMAVAFQSMSASQTMAGLSGAMRLLADVPVTAGMAGGATAAAMASMAVGAGLAIKSLQKSQEHGKEAAQEYMDSLIPPANNVYAIQKRMQEIDAQIKALQLTYEDAGYAQKFFQDANPFVDNNISEHEAEAEALGKEHDALYRTFEALNAKTQARQDATAAAKAGIATEQQLNDLNVEAYDNTIKQARAELSLSSAIDKLNADQEAYLENQKEIAGTSQNIIDIRNEAAETAKSNAAAEVAAADAITEAEYGRVQSLKALDNAQFGVQTALWAREEAVLSVQAAEDNLATLEAKSLQLTEDLTQARKDATEALYSMERAQKGDALSVKSAQFALDDAIRRAEEGPSNNQWDDPNAQAKLDLGVEQAQLALEEANARAAESQQELTDAQKAGVDGSPQVIAAQEAIKQNADDIVTAQHSLTVQQRGLINADRAVATAHDGVATAQRGVKTATDRVTTAQNALQAAYAKTAKDARDAEDKIKVIQDEARKNSDKLKRAIVGDMLDIAEAGKNANRELAIMYTLLAGVSGGLPPELKAIVDAILADLKPVENTVVNPGPNKDGSSGWTPGETTPSGPLPGPNPDGTSGYYPPVKKPGPNPDGTSGYFVPDTKTPEPTPTPKMAPGFHEPTTLTPTITVEVPPVPEQNAPPPIVVPAPLLPEPAAPSIAVNVPKQTPPPITIEAPSVKSLAPAPVLEKTQEPVKQSAPEAPVEQPKYAAPAITLAMPEQTQPAPQQPVPPGPTSTPAVRYNAPAPIFTQPTPEPPVYTPPPISVNVELPKTDPPQVTVTAPVPKPNTRPEPIDTRTIATILRGVDLEAKADPAVAAFFKTFQHATDEDKAKLKEAIAASKPKDVSAPATVATPKPLTVDTSTRPEPIDVKTLATTLRGVYAEAKQDPAVAAFFKTFSHATEEDKAKLAAAMKQSTPAMPDPNIENTPMMFERPEPVPGPPAYTPPTVAPSPSPGVTMPKLRPDTGGTVNVIVKNLDDLQPGGDTTNVTTINTRATDPEDVVRAWNRKFARPGQ